MSSQPPGAVRKTVDPASFDPIPEILSFLGNRDLRAAFCVSKTWNGHRVGVLNYIQEESIKDADLAARHIIAVLENEKNCAKYAEHRQMLLKELGKFQPKRFHVELVLLKREDPQHDVGIIFRDALGNVDEESLGELQEELKELTHPLAQRWISLIAIDKQYHGSLEEPASAEVQIEIFQKYWNIDFESARYHLLNLQVVPGLDSQKRARAHILEVLKELLSKNLPELVVFLGQNSDMPASYIILAEKLRHLVGLNQQRIAEQYLLEQRRGFRSLTLLSYVKNDSMMVWHPNFQQILLFVKHVAEAHFRKFNSIVWSRITSINLIVHYSEVPLAIAERLPHGKSKKAAIGRLAYNLAYGKLPDAIRLMHHPQNIPYRDVMAAAIITQLRSVWYKPEKELDEMWELMAQALVLLDISLDRAEYCANRIRDPQKKTTVLMLIIEKLVDHQRFKAAKRIAESISDKQAVEQAFESIVSAEVALTFERHRAGQAEASSAKRQRTAAA